MTNMPQPSSDRKADCLLHFAACQSKFRRKSDWLQHVETHLRLSAFRCNICGAEMWSKGACGACARHLREELPPDNKTLAALAEKCRIEKMRPLEPLTCCSQVFEQSGVCERYVEHVWEMHCQPRKRNDAKPFNPDDSFIQLALHFGIVKYEDSVYRLVEYKRRVAAKRRGRRRRACGFCRKRHVSSSESKRLPIHTTANKTLRSAVAALGSMEINARSTPPRMRTVAMSSGSLGLRTSPRDYHDTVTRERESSSVDADSVHSAIQCATLALVDVPAAKLNWEDLLN